MRVTLFLIVTLCLLAPGAQALDSLGRGEQHWTIGLGFGTGRADVQYFGGDVEEKLREGVNTELRGGRLLTPHLALTLEYQGWMLEDGDLSVLSGRVRQGLQIWGVGLNWYPGNPANAWGGLVVRGAVGPALANFAITLIDENLLELEEARLDEWGWGANLTVGYEWFLTHTFAVGPMLNAGYLSVDEELVDRAAWTTLSISGAWYF